MKKKLILICLLSFFCFGCSTDYNLTIAGDEFTEKIHVEVDESAFTDLEKKETYMDIRDADLYATNNKKEDEKYNKKITKSGNITKMDLSYTYDADTFAQSHLISSCFEYHAFQNEKSYYYIKLGGRFWCNYGPGTVDVKIKTDYRVLQNNADTVSGTTYTWKIDPMDPSEKQIMLQVLKTEKVAGKSGNAVVTLILLVTLFAGLSVLFWSLGQKIISKIDKHTRT